MRTLKIYLASPSQKWPEMRVLHHRIPELIQCQVQIVSEWYFDDKIGYELSDAELHDAAQRDLRDLRKADIYIGFWAKESPGGMHVELGYSLARGYQCYIVGEMSNVFHRLIFCGDLSEVCSKISSNRS